MRKPDIDFTKGGESIVVQTYHRQFASLQILCGLMNASLVFHASYLMHVGLSATEVGFFISLASLAGMLSPMFWGMMSDRFRTIKKILYVCLAAMLVFYFPIPFYSRLTLGALSLAPLLIVFQAVFSNTPEGMLTAWIMHAQRVHHAIQYGYLRMFFIASYAFSNAMYMFLIPRTSIEVIFAGYAVFAVLNMALLTRYPDVQMPESTQSKHFSDMQIGRVFRNPMLVSYMLFMAIACIPSASSLGVFVPYLIEEIGSDKSLLGGILAVRALCGVPALYLSRWIAAKLRPRTLLILATSVYVLTQAIFVVSTSMLHLILNSVLMGTAMGLRLPAEAAFINEETPEGLVATTQTICGTTYSIAGILSGVLGGYVVDQMGIRTYFVIISILLAIAVLFFYAATAIIQKRREVRIV